MPEPISIPLSASHQRDVAALVAQRDTAQAQINVIARTLIGVAHDPAALEGYAWAFGPDALTLTPGPSHG